MHKIFVFGTLKKGFPNFSINKGKRFRGDFETKECFPFYLMGERYSPWLVIDIGNGYPVKGQVFEVSDDALAAMDALERIHEPDGYRRIIIEVLCLEKHEYFSVYAYGKPSEMVEPSEIKYELVGEYKIEHADLYRNRSG